MLNLELDHLGLIVKSIEKELLIYKTLGYEEDSSIFEDENQQMRGLFLKHKMNDGCRIELIEDYSESRFLTKLLNCQNGKIYHLAYKVRDIEKELSKIVESLDAQILSPIKEASYYNKVCFILLKNMQIIELVEYRC